MHAQLHVHLSVGVGIFINFAIDDATIENMSSNAIGMHMQNDTRTHTCAHACVLSSSARSIVMCRGIMRR